MWFLHPVTLTFDIFNWKLALHLRLNVYAYFDISTLAATKLCVHIHADIP